MLPSKHVKSDAEVWPSTSLAELSLPPLSLKEQTWLEDYGWNEFKALLVENGLDPHNIEHATKAVRVMRENGDKFGKLIPRLSEELAENNIARQSPRVQDRKEKEVLRETPRNDDHAQQPIDSAKDRQSGLGKYAQNGEETQKPERKVGLSVFVGNDYKTPYFVIAPDKEEQKKLPFGPGAWRIMEAVSSEVNNRGKYFFVSLKRHKKRVVFYREHGKKQIKEEIQATQEGLRDGNQLVSVPKTLQDGQQQESEQHEKSQEKQKAQSQAALVTAIQFESSGNEDRDGDAEDPLPRERTNEKARLIIEKAIEVARVERQKTSKNGSVALPRQYHSG
ncbi:hypothetical protein OCU04_003415 [Sclerotinia nivalis]|uniref:Uncharacterized protein n=1 Tax=Sclerotinia nivalis TaxID=352851 RepID=A0A9X0DLU1_9HELO|nr:hypothetical protein OCU04_003415 [Sclerotinia nivalis]